MCRVRGQAARVLVAVRGRLGSDDGFTLIEVLVVLSMLTIAMMVTISWAESIFKTQSQQVQWTAQADTDRFLADYVTKRLHDAPARLGLAREADSSKTDALTVAGDQVVIADATASSCFRIWYSTTAQEVRARYGACSTIRPRRGPSESTPADPVLDDPTASLLLADHVQLTNGATPSAPLFRYLDANGAALLLDEVAYDYTGNSAAPWYQQRSNADQIDVVRLAGFVLSGSTYATTKPQPFDRRLVVSP